MLRCCRSYALPNEMAEARAYLAAPSDCSSAASRSGPLSAPACRHASERALRSRASAPSWSSSITTQPGPEQFRQPTTKLVHVILGPGETDRRHAERQGEDRRMVGPGHHYPAPAHLRNHLRRRRQIISTRGCVVVSTQQLAKLSRVLGDAPARNRDGAQRCAMCARELLQDGAHAGEIRGVHGGVSRHPEVDSEPVTQFRPAASPPRVLRAIIARHHHPCRVDAEVSEQPRGRPALCTAISSTPGRTARQRARSSGSVSGPTPDRAWRVFRRRSRPRAWPAPWPRARENGPRALPVRRCTRDWYCAIAQGTRSGRSRPRGRSEARQ